MDTILLLTDFSYTAFNAARYAVSLANQLQSARVILYHSLFSDSLDAPPPFASEVEDVWSQAMERLNELKSSLEAHQGRTIQIDIIANHDPLPVINNTCEAEKVGMVIMGATGNNKMQGLFIGGHTLSLSDACTLPLLIIPPDTIFETIEKVVFACDVQNTNQIPVHSIEIFIQSLHATLSIVFDERTGFNDKLLQQQIALFKLIDSIDPQFSFIRGEDRANDILHFSQLKNAQMIIIIHNKERFLQNIFHPGFPKTSSFNSHFPVLVLKLKGKGESRNSFLNDKIKKSQERALH